MVVASADGCSDSNRFFSSLMILFNCLFDTFIFNIPCIRLIHEGQRARPPRRPVLI